MTRLRRAYIEYNALWFRGQLPSDLTVVWCSSMGNTSGDYEEGTIRINTALKRFYPVWRLTLLHEMAHAATDSESKEHGPRWLRLMRSLAKRGAFNSLW